MSKFGTQFRDRADGAYGGDEFGRFLLCVSTVLIIIGLYWSPRIVGTIGLAILAYTIYRMFSTKFMTRSKENDVYLDARAKVVGFFRHGFKGFKAGRSSGPKPVKQHRSVKEAVEDRKKYKYFKCPQCSQKLRVPRGKGKVRIICPKCKTEFQRKS